MTTVKPREGVTLLILLPMVTMTLSPRQMRPRAMPSPPQASTPYTGLTSYIQHIVIILLINIIQHQHVMDITLPVRVVVDGRLVDVPDGDQGPDTVAYIIGSVRQSSKACSKNLQLLINNLITIIRCKLEGTIRCWLPTYLKWSKDSLDVITFVLILQAINPYTT